VHYLDPNDVFCKLILLKCQKCRTKQTVKQRGQNDAIPLK